MTEFCDTLNPSTNNRERCRLGQSEHAAPDWMRILSIGKSPDLNRIRINTQKRLISRNGSKPVRWVSPDSIIDAESISALAKLIGCSGCAVSLALKEDRPIRGGRVALLKKL